MSKRVVVVGGGIAGTFIAKQLTRHHADPTTTIDLTLIDTKEYFEHTPGVTPSSPLLSASPLPLSFCVLYFCLHILLTGTPRDARVCHRRG
jgi:hypothetical protein